MDRKTLANIVSKVEKENKIFAKKSVLDTLTFPTKIIGREKQAEDLVKYLLGYKQGHVVPLISVYGRSGSGKSTLVKFVSQNLEGISYCFVNLRKAKTVFGAANLIMAELGQSSLKSAQGINLAVEKIGQSIESKLQQESTKLFVLVLDEFDVIFNDKRGKPSDFVYKLIVLEENLRGKSYLLCIVCISNNILSDYELDDRVKSRIGNSEIFFEPYSKLLVHSILKERAKDAFSYPIDTKVIEECATLSSTEHGDARRAIDLLRVAAEIANSKGEKLDMTHVNLASDELQKDRIERVLTTASYHLRLALASIARLSFLTDQEWHSTSTLYNQYLKILDSKTKSLSYRRVSDLLTELENTGLLVSQTASKGRHGYGTQYKLVVSPETVGSLAFKEWWEVIVKQKKDHELSTELSKIQNSFSRKRSLAGEYLKDFAEKNWNDYLGL